jgi:hypothetical protein
MNFVKVCLSGPYQVPVSCRRIAGGLLAYVRMVAKPLAEPGSGVALEPLGGFLSTALLSL